MSEQAAVQLANPTALYVGAAILTVLGMVPGMPHLVFLMLAGGAAALALALQRKAQSVAFEATEAEQERQAKPSTKELDWDDLDTVDLIGLEVGYGLVPRRQRRRGPAYDPCPRCAKETFGGARLSGSPGSYPR